MLLYNSCFPYPHGGFPGGAVLKDLLANAGGARDSGSIPGLGSFPWRMKWQPMPVFLPGESHGQRTGVLRWMWLSIHPPPHTHTHTYTSSFFILRQPPIYFYHYRLAGLSRLPCNWNNAECISFGLTFFSSILILRFICYSLYQWLYFYFWITCLWLYHSLSVYLLMNAISSVQSLSCVPHGLWDPVDCSTPGFPVHHQLPESAQIHVHWVNDAIQLSHLLLSPSPPAFNLSHHQNLLQWVSSIIRWPKYWSFSFIISPSNAYSGFISSRIDWFDLLAVQGTLKESSPTPQFKSINS